MPVQRLSLFGALPGRHLESLVGTLQGLTHDPLTQFKTLTQVYSDTTTPQGRRPSDFLRIQTDSSSASVSPPVLEVMDAPEINKRPVTSRVVHVVPCTHGDPATLAQGMGYGLAYGYFEQGYSLMLATVQVRIYQVFKAQERERHGEVLKEGEEVTEEMEGIVIGDGKTWIVQCDVQVKMGAQEDLRRGTEDLLRLKKEIVGNVDLVPLMDELR